MHTAWYILFFIYAAIDFLSIVDLKEFEELLRPREDCLRLFVSVLVFLQKTDCLIGT
jgi:hypothetical protein